MRGVRERKSVLLPQGKRAYTTMRKMPVNNVKPFTLNKEEKKDEEDEEEEEGSDGERGKVWASACE